MIIKVIIDQIINIKLFRIMYIMLNGISETVAHTTYLLPQLSNANLYDHNSRC